MTKLFVNFLFIITCVHVHSSEAELNISSEEKNVLIKNYDSSVNKGSLSPVGQLSFANLGGINACLNHGGSYDSSGDDFNDWSIEVYEFNEGSVIRFFVRGLEDAETLCFIDANGEVLGLRQ
ncbi:hypothetical protein [Microbulbifer sp. ARAS458-1]|uniref:hypothetical protein n=1 Tax=Microbulbifer sp. ARAS458-1 TaxID=3140242 RepID=UPI003877B051